MSDPQQDERRGRVANRLLELVVMMPVALLRVGQALLGIAAGLVVVLLLIHGAR